MQGGDGAPGRLYHGRGHGRAGQDGREREETINFEAFFPYPEKVADFLSGVCSILPSPLDIECETMITVK